MDAPAIIAAIVVVVVLVVVARVLAPWRPDGRETTTSTIASMIPHGIGSAQVSPPEVSRTHDRWVRCKALESQSPPAIVPTRFGHVPWPMCVVVRTAALG